MKKICFLADRFLWEDGIKNLLYQELYKIAEEDITVDFCFHGCHEVFAKEAVSCILELKKCFPESKLSVVAIADPLKDQEGELDKEEEGMLRRDEFPKDCVDRIEYAPLFDGKCEKYNNRFIQHYYKIDRWLYQQCDDMIAYYYDNLPNRTLRSAKSAVSGNPLLTMHHLYLPDTRDRIDILIEQLPERERAAVLALNAGKTCRDIAAEYGVSYNRVRQYVNKADVRIRRWLRQN